MPIQVTYPGVYIEELPSGQHTVTPVATNIAAFVGRAPIGPTDVPVTIFNFGDFTRAFGGLSFDYPLSYAVQDFFANGGSQAIIVRLFEPASGDGVAQLKFPVPPLTLPDGWRLDAAVSVGATQLTVAEPSGGAEGEPDVGMQVTVGGDPTPYLVTGFTPADPSKKQQSSITVVPALIAGYQKCTPLTFTAGSSASGWKVSSQSGVQVTLLGGSGVPELGDNLQVGSDPTVYTAISEPTISGTDPSTMQLVLTITPKPATPFASGAVVIVSSPQALPLPVGWEIDQCTGPKSGLWTLSLINGQGAPIAGDWFTVGAQATPVYVVKAYRPLTPTAPDQIDFVRLDGNPVDGTALCHCCAPTFTRPAPTNWSIKSGPKIGATSFTVASTSASTGVIDIGDTFTVGGGDTLVYSVRHIDQATNVVYFLPPADTAFNSTNNLTFQPPLALKAANPGKWGNRLSARTDLTGITAATAKQFSQYDLEQVDLFNLTLTLEDARGKLVAKERYLNLSVRNSGSAARFPNRVDRVLASQSNLARVARLSAVPPGDGASVQGVGGDDGTNLATTTYLGDQSKKTGLYMLEHVQLFNLLCIPPDRRIFPEVPDEEQDLDPLVRQAAAEYCASRSAFYIVDPPVDWKNKARQGQISEISPEHVGITGTSAGGVEVARNAAVYFPRIWKEDVLMKGQPALFAPCGVIAGVMAATDVSRGVWKAPAGVDAGMANVLKLEVSLTDDENGQLNPLGINCLRNFPIIGPVVWGARTLRGADQFEDEYKYIPVRRLTLFIEGSLMRATQWAVFEPNDEALWSSLRLTAEAFLADLSRQGAFYNYKVTCDATTTTPDDISNGIVNILLQIAPVKPAEFVVIQIQQTAGASPS